MNGHRQKQACVIDTVVLHRANQARLQQPGETAQLRKRRLLLQDVGRGQWLLLVSPNVLIEYRGHLVRPLNDLVRSFLEYATTPDSSESVGVNWRALSGNERDLALRRCRFPAHDLRLLRTAYGYRSTIFSEEDRVVRTDACIHRSFQVHLVDPTA